MYQYNALMKEIMDEARQLQSVQESLDIIIAKARLPPRKELTQCCPLNLKTVE